jgi:cell division protein FtsL
MEATEKLLNETEKRLSVHEAICSERYERIEESFRKGIERMQKIEKLLYAIIACIVLGPSFTAEIIKQLIK